MKVHRCVLIACMLAGSCLNAATISTVTITRSDPGSVIQWDTPTGSPMSDVWRELSGRTYGAYAANPLTLNPGDTGTLVLRLEGFNGLPSLGAAGYLLQIVHGPDALQLNCTVSGGSCLASGPNGFANGLTISNFGLVGTEVNQVKAFADVTAPGSGPDSAIDLIATFDYSLARVSEVPEPATMLLSAAGLAALALLRRRN